MSVRSSSPREPRGAAPALEASQLRFQFKAGTRPALDGVDVRVEEGSFTGLLGPNGAGKTTFVNIVCGLLEPQSGDLRVFGHRASTHEARRAIGFCPQDLALFPTLSAAENLRVFGRLSGLRGRTLSARVDACLAIARLTSDVPTRVERFSGGMKRRLNLAVALLHQPRLLVLDEPTVGVDIQSRLAIFETLETLHAADTTILYTSHYMEEIERLCDRVIVIDHGRVVASGPTAVIGGRSLPMFRLKVRSEHEALELARRTETGGVHARVVDGSDIELSADDLGVLTNELARLVATGAVLACETLRPSLEERFLTLTGSDLGDRDEVR